MSEENKKKFSQKTSDRKPAIKEKKEPHDAIPSHSSYSFWQVWLKPIVVLVVICAISSSLLVFTNELTTPIIAANTLATEDAVRKALLPSASSFEDVTPSPLPDGISSVYKANDDLGYVIGAFSQGYGGEVPVLVGIDATGTITGVQFLENNETPGLGQKVVTDKSFAEQFIGRKANIQIDANASATEEADANATATTKTDGNAAATATATVSEEAGLESGSEQLDSSANDEALEESTNETDGTGTATTATATATATQEPEIQAIAAATISSNAAENAVNNALEYYEISIMGSTISYAITDDVLQSLDPTATSWDTLSVKAADVASAYRSNNGIYVIVSQGKSQNTIYAAVAMDEEGTITALWLDTSQESPNYGKEIDENEEYISQYIGKKNTDDIQGIAGVTNSSNGVKAAVDAALDALPAAKEAA